MGKLSRILGVLFRIGLVVGAIVVMYILLSFFVGMTSWGVPLAKVVNTVLNYGIYLLLAFIGFAFVMAFTRNRKWYLVGLFGSLGLTIALCIFVVTANKGFKEDEKIAYQMEKRAKVEAESTDSVSCNGYTVHFVDVKTKGSEYQSAILLNPIEVKIWPDDLASFGMTYHMERCSLSHNRIVTKGAKEHFVSCPGSTEKIDSFIAKVKANACPYEDFQIMIGFEEPKVISPTTVNKNLPHN